MARHKKIERRRELDRRRRRRRKRLKLRAKGLLPPTDNPAQSQPQASSNEDTQKEVSEEQSAAIEGKE